MRSISMLFVAITASLVIAAPVEKRAKKCKSMSIPLTTSLVHRILTAKQFMVSLKAVRRLATGASPESRAKTHVQHF
jgi:hypothetical protein